ncbi:MAG: alanine--tRNA ligase [Nanoarchaeota archaeon]|nr:alanine--tRNA ligase [Nanoarchaeota archaeon]
MITRKTLIAKYLDFFKSKNHKIIPSESLIPKNDPTVLFTTAGMHPLVPYLLGQRHPLGKRLANVQRCIRTTDIDAVGDASHHTFFEMLGNWSLGDYWKKEAIEWSYEFLTKELKIKPEKISVTCFAGDKDAPKDVESANTWKSLGIKKIKFLGKKENWWGPAGKTGPCGPDTEMFVNGVEIWNDVFMQYNKDENGKFLPAKQKNVDTGMGVERTLAILNGLDDNYMTEVWKPIIDEILKIGHKKVYEKSDRHMRIIADHVKASVFIIADGIVPSNIGRGYVLRRLIRRAIRWGQRYKLKDFTDKVAEPVFKIYENYYPELKENKNKILETLRLEEKRFNETIEKGLLVFTKLQSKIVDKHIKKYKNKIKRIESFGIFPGKDAFLLYQSYGFPPELIEEECKNRGMKFDKKAFEQELKKHQKLSRTASAGTFKSGLADHSEKTICLHTATHLLNQALRTVLGPEVKQRGSNITPERLRFDFNFPRKLTQEEISEVEVLVNKKISEAMPVEREEMSLKEALSMGAQAEFGMKYPERVSVYFIGGFSKEICTGPHVRNTREIGKFKIIKEESSAAGIRRIKAVVE